MYIALFLTSLLFLFTVGHSKKCIQYYSTVVAILVLIPVLAMLPEMYFQHFYIREQIYWLLPISGVIAYATVLLTDKVQDLNTKKMMMPIICIIMLLCGGITGYTKYQDTVVEEKAEYTEVFDILSGEMDSEILLVAPEEIISRARLYDTDILTVYGRDMWETNLDAYFYDQYSPQVYSLYEHMKQPLGSYPATFLMEIEKLGVTHVVFNKENLTFDEDLHYPHRINAGQGIYLSKLGETYHYVIYQVK